MPEETTELVYDGKGVEDIIKKQYPNCKIEDASDYIHEQRFQVTVKDTQDNFWLFALKKGFATLCLGFSIEMYEDMPRIQKLMKLAKIKIGDSK